MALDPQGKRRLADAYNDHMSAIKAFESHRPGGGATEFNESRYFTTEARLDRIADEVGVTEQDYDELEQSIEREEGWSIG
jgi:hypothetical protein